MSRHFWWTALALALVSCASPNLYVSARPLGRGVVQHTIALEGLGAVAPSGAAVIPTAPSWQVRVGVAQRVDLMARLVNLSGLGLDALISLAQGPVDLAIVPGVRGAYLPFSAGRPGMLAAQLPLLIGVRLADRWSLLVTAGGGVVVGLGPSASAPVTARAAAESPDASTQGFFVRGGLGLRWRVSEGLVLHPELTALFTPASGRTALVGGLGFVFGGLGAVGE